MTISVRISRLRPLATVALLAACASAGAQTYAPPPAPSAPAYDSGDPANANLALVDRSPEPPPALPVYVQPPAPADGYMWVPGYWSRNRYGFFWVPGAWVLAPYSGALWTPGYWGFVNGLYVWNAGYWGPHVGFYGGINYGFGYVGIGYVGGYWNRDRFYYNRSVTNVNVTRVTNVYNHTVVVNNIDNRRVSYHGGPDGIRRNADPRELAARNDRHAPPTDMQRGFVRDAGNNRAQFYDHNKGRPPQAFVDHPDNNRRPSEGQRPGGNARPPEGGAGTGPNMSNGNGRDPGRDHRPGPGANSGNAAPGANVAGSPPPRTNSGQTVTGTARPPQSPAPQQARDHGQQQAQQQQQQQQQRQQQAQQQQARDQQLRQQQERDQQAQHARQQQNREQQQARQQQARDSQQQQAREQQHQQRQQAQQQARQQAAPRPEGHPQQQGGGRDREAQRGEGRGGGPNRD
ncbi:adenylate cyclase [Achromobacter pestifer]